MRKNAVFARFVLKKCSFRFRDYTVAENFFGIMKSELLYAEKFETPEAFMKALEEYIDYYNNKRIKSRLKGKSPVQYRTLSQNG